MNTYERSLTKCFDSQHGTGISRGILCGGGPRDRPARTDLLKSVFRLMNLSLGLGGSSFGCLGSVWADDLTLFLLERRDQCTGQLLRQHGRHAWDKKTSLTFPRSTGAIKIDPNLTFVKSLNN